MIKATNIVLRPIEAVSLLVGYLFAGYPVECIIAFTESGNMPAQRVMGSIGFQQEGVLRRSIFRDIAIYGLLREDVTLAGEGAAT